MRAILVNASESMIEQRRSLGIDKLDERWEGEWHLVNPPKWWHIKLNTDLLMVLVPHARSADLDGYGDASGLFADPEDDWRVPDQIYAHDRHVIPEGLSGAELVVEIRSPDDDTYRKFPFYAARGVTEILVVHEDRRFELYRLDAERGEYERAGDTSSVLGVTFATVDGPRLRVSWEGGSAEV